MEELIYWEEESLFQALLTKKFLLCTTTQSNEQVFPKEDHLRLSQTICTRDLTSINAFTNFVNCMYLKHTTEEVAIPSKALLGIFLLLTLPASHFKNRIAVSFA